MKAAYIEQPGPPSVIQYGDLPDPTIGPRQVLVRIGAVAVNPIDTYLRGGAAYWETPQPYIPGADFAGTIEQVGSEVTRFQPGQRVWGTNQGFMGRQGVFAELAAIDEDWVYATPSNVLDEDAAACALVGVTAHLGLFSENAHLQPSETVFIQGGSGGVGSMVIQMAKRGGAKVIATAGSPEKLDLCRELGADLAIDYTQGNVAEQVKDFAPQGVNVVWETQREPNFDFLVDIAAERGRIVLMAGRDARPEFPVGPFYVKQLSLHGFVMFKATPDRMRVCGEEISKWLGEGKLKSRISTILPLSEAAQAHQLQEDNTLNKAGTIAGKIVLKP